MNYEDRIKLGKRADEIAAIGETLTEEEIERLVPESQLVKKLPVYFHKKMTEEELDLFIKHQRRFLAATHVYNQRKQK